ncbi:pheA operon leader peptide PheL [Enterobacillus tribolii]|nr:pheA operon leader peptide PheL [Enterobacillus tribolii]MBW7984543.1 hypothetical protein [Enterobacillus tribolii]
MTHVPFFFAFFFTFP